MLFWNRKRREDAVTRVGRMIDLLVGLRSDMGALHDEMAELRARVHEPVPTNGGPRAGSVQEWLPVLDRAHEIALVAMGHPDLAQAFGASSRQKEFRQVESQVETAWTEPDEGSTYENV